MLRELSQRPSDWLVVQPAKPQHCKRECIYKLLRLRLYLVSGYWRMGMLLRAAAHLLLDLAHKEIACELP